MPPEDNIFTALQKAGVTAGYNRQRGTTVLIVWAVFVLTTWLSVLAGVWLMFLGHRTLPLVIFMFVMFLLGMISTPRKE